MKKTFFLLLVCAFALVPSGKAQVGVHAGYSPDQWMTANDTLKFNSFVFGIDFLIPISGDLNVTIGCQGRWSIDRDDDGIQVDTNHRTNVVGVEIPVLVNYNFRVTDKFSITPFAGPKFSYYIRGRSRNSSGHPIYEWFEDKQKPMNRFNISATFGVAVGYQQFHLYGGYNLGFSDMNYRNKETTVGGPFVGFAVGF